MSAFLAQWSQLSQAGLYVLSVDGLQADCNILRSVSFQSITSVAQPVPSRLPNGGSVCLEVEGLFEGPGGGL